MVQYSCISNCIPVVHGTAGNEYLVTGIGGFSVTNCFHLYKHFSVTVLSITLPYTLIWGHVLC